MSKPSNACIVATSLSATLVRRSRAVSNVAIRLTATSALPSRVVRYIKANRRNRIVPGGGVVVGGVWSGGVFGEKIAV